MREKSNETGNTVNYRATFCPRNYPFHVKECSKHNKNVIQGIPYVWKRSTFSQKVKATKILEYHVRLKNLSLSLAIVIMAKGIFEGTLCDLVERELETTRSWCLSVGLRINSSKTTGVSFTRRTRLQHLRSIRFNDENLEWRQEVKYLGP